MCKWEILAAQFLPEPTVHTWLLHLVIFPLEWGFFSLGWVFFSLDGVL